MTSRSGHVIWCGLVLVYRAVGVGAAGNAGWDMFAHCGDI